MTEQAAVVVNTAPAIAREGAAPPRALSATALKAFAIWTAIFWGGTVVLGTLFYLGVIDFETSTRVSLYGTSIWLNGWILPFLLKDRQTRDRDALWHDALVLWMISYTMTNVLWEIPWVLSSPFIFENLHTLEDVIARTDWMREHPLHMFWWVMASFSVVDLRTVNHDATFYALEFFAFFNVAAVILFFRLNARRSPMRYLIPVIGCGEPIAATFIFSFSEVFGGFTNMPGGVADTLLALVWTQYQYILFPLIFGIVCTRLWIRDLHAAWRAQRT